MIKNKKWEWNKKTKNAFQKLRRVCINKSIFKMFDSSKSIQIEAKASNLAINACFNQKIESKWHSVTYYSRKFSSAKQNYDIHDKKLLIIIASLKQWRVYAEKSSESTIYTNHKNLLHFIIIKQLNKRQMRWSKLLEQYKFTIQYTSEKENEKADVLSWENDHMKEKELINKNILKINKNDSLSASAQELNATFRILRDQNEQYFIKKNDWSYSRKRSTKLLENITTSHCKNISKYRRFYNFYDDIVDSQTRNVASRHTSEDVLAVRKTNTILTESTKKFNIKRHRKRHEKKSRWTS